MTDRPISEVSVPLWELDMENRKLGDRKLKDLKQGTKFLLGDLLFKVTECQPSPTGTSSGGSPTTPAIA